MRRLNALAVVVCASAIAITAANAGQTWRDRAYDATYSSNNSTLGAGTMRLAADGHGHALMEMHRSKGNNTILMDANNSTCYTITQMPTGQKMAMKAPYNDEAFTAKSADYMKRKNAHPLGVKMIAGHPCHGFTYTLEDGSTHEDWVGDDIDMLVMGTSSSGRSGTTTLTIQSFSNQAPSQSAFSVPADAKVMDLSNMSHMYGGAGAGAQNYSAPAYGAPGYNSPGQ